MIKRIIMRLFSWLRRKPAEKKNVNFKSMTRAIINDPVKIYQGTKAQQKKWAKWKRRERIAKLSRKINFAKN